jgi:hypothetical protein
MTWFCAKCRHEFPADCDSNADCPSCGTRAKRNDGWRVWGAETDADIVARLAPPVVLHSVNADGSWLQYTQPAAPPTNADIIAHGGEYWPSVEGDRADVQWQLDPGVDIYAALAYLRDDEPRASVLAVGARGRVVRSPLRTPRVVSEFAGGVRNASVPWPGNPIYRSVCWDLGFDPLLQKAMRREPTYDM